MRHRSTVSVLTGFIARSLSMSRSTVGLIWTWKSFEHTGRQHAFETIQSRVPDAKKVPDHHSYKILDKMVVIGRTADLDNFIDVSQPTKLYKSTWYQFKDMKARFSCAPVSATIQWTMSTHSPEHRKRRQYFVNLCASGSRIEISCSRDEKPYETKEDEEIIREVIRHSCRDRHIYCNRGRKIWTPHHQPTLFR
jgi:hypothetical protein